MIEILLVCYITFTPFTPIDGWTITEVNNRANSAAVTIRGKARDGEVLRVPAGCRLDEPQSPSSILFVPTPAIPLR